ncbi:MAG: hypothetical protein ACMXYE_02505 [Candidatus Woesearchaeota archaeon]
MLGIGRTTESRIFVIREILREKLFESEAVSGKLTYSASQESLGKNWLSKEEDEAWAHLQKEI